MKTLGWRFIPLLCFVSLVIFFWRGLSLDPKNLPSVQIGRALPEFSLPQLHDPTTFVHSKQLLGKVALLNVWASWCAACIEEQIFLLQLSEQGITIYGLNYKDKPLEAINWLIKWGNPYKQVMNDARGKVAIDLGVYGAPETFVLDKKGLIRYRHVGVLNNNEWSNNIAPLMSQLEKEE
jgi:cytochrome c biogenesis protein CcmG/thiol:disulfide interchange protein DsbE